MLRHLIGIDIGTTGTKSMLIREDGQVIAHAYQGYPLSSPSVGRSEQNAEAWWEAVVHTVHDVLAAAPGAAGQVVAISLSTQGGTMVPVDQQGMPLRPAIVWNDSRCGDQQRAFEAALGAERMYHSSGWTLGRGLNALQIAWLRQHEPQVFEQTAHFLSVHDFLSYRLTGQRAVDISNAGINQVADITRKAYDTDILAFCGVREEQLARLVDSGRPIAPLTVRAAQALGLPQDVLLVAGAHDQYAACVGAGINRPGRAMIGSGTAWVVTALGDKADFSRGFAQSRAAVEGLWGSIVSLSTGGVSLDWLLQSVISDQPSSAKPDYVRLNEQAAQRPIGGGGLMFFPYFRNASFPLPPADWHASFLGLDLSHDRYSMARAVMEGVACHIAWVLEQFPVDDPSAPVVLSGGAGKSPVWRQLLADILGRPLRIPTMADLPCIGAGILAGLGSGVFDNPDEALARFSPEEMLIQPDPEHIRTYRDYQQLYRRRAKGLAALYQEPPRESRSI